MKQTIPLGRMAGIRIGAHRSVLVTVVLIGWLRRALSSARVRFWSRRMRAGCGLP
jgi:hypothetical protein